MRQNIIDKATEYCFLDSAGLQELMEYYNVNCFPLVKPSRRYRIQKGDNWCAMFTSVIAHKMGLGVESFPYEVGVMEQVKIAKERGIFTTDWREISKGDLIIYDWKRNGWADHVGFVDKIDRDLITTIEGNYHSTVRSRTLSTNSKAIMGFIKLVV